MIGMICVREDVFNGLGPEESADHRTSSGRRDGERRCRVTELLFHMGSSITGLLHGIAERNEQGFEVRVFRNVEPGTSNFGSRFSRMSRASRATVCGACGAQKGLEQSPVEGVPFEEKFRVPLDAEKKAMGRRFDRLHDTIGGQGAGDQ